MTVWLAVLMAAVALPVLATDPKPSDIFTALKAGNLPKAQQMIDQVLASHPNDARAHFVAAEVAARRGNFADARQQLARAEQIAPGLPNISTHAVSKLRAQLAKSVPLSSPNPAPRVNYPAPVQTPMRRDVHYRSFPSRWLFLLGGIALMWVLFARRASYRRYPGPVSGTIPMGGMGGGPVMGGPVVGGGGGVVSGLASGLAIGAGVAAGEELVHHMLDVGVRHSGGFIPDAGAAEAYQQQDYFNPNTDIGGNDFGFSNDSWGDSGDGGDFGGGGDDTG